MRDPLVIEEIMLIGATFCEGGGGGRVNVPIKEEYLNIPMPTL
jgi:hypothetical protein